MIKDKDRDRAPSDSDLLVPFERDNIKDDYRFFYTIKRNNLFSSIQNFPEHWEFFCRLDEIWRREIGDLEVAVDPTRTFPVVLYMNAHAKMRISMELAFSNCLPEARSILRDAVESVAHAHHMLRDPANQLIWLNKDEASGEQEFKRVFEHNKRTGLFAGLQDLHKTYGELSEAGSHPTLQSFVNRVSMEHRDAQRCLTVNYSGAPERRLFAIELFSRLLVCVLMERTFFNDFNTRFELDARLVRMRRNFETFKERLRRTVIERYKVQPPPAKPTTP